MAQAGDVISTAGDVPASGAVRRWFIRFSAFTLGYTLLVILFGAWVRITGSGAGCGDHWPTCHGELLPQSLPRSPGQQTLIEYTHRVTSGALGILALVLPLAAWRSFPAGHAARRYAWMTLGLVCVEAAIGAGLVLGQLVASDASAARALAVALHLGNTLLLTAAATLTVAAARSAEPARVLHAHVRAAPTGGARLMILLGVLVLVSMTGAVTALGDTLFPARASDVRWVAPPADHFLVQLRVLHPVLAALGVCFAAYVARHFFAFAGTRAWALVLGSLAAAQLVVGVINIVLNAPGTLQLVHLLLGQLLWMSAVLLAWCFWQARRARPA